MDKRQIINITIGSLVVGSIGYFAYTKIRNAKEIKFIHAALEGSGGYGTIKDFANVFQGNAYIDSIKNKYPNVILLVNDAITANRKALYNAIKGVGTDTDEVKNVFRNLKDKVQIAQVADSYQRNYKTNLLDAIMDEFTFRSGSENADELTEIMKSKPDFRVAG
ncbi:MAG: hypothetical protein PHT69_01965 [Bacteroidales bacterium]|nr:hypothetical protein [Bacteroidales bacterium]